MKIDHDLVSQLKKTYVSSFYMQNSVRMGQIVISISKSPNRNCPNPTSMTDSVRLTQNNL